MSWCLSEVVEATAYNQWIESIHWVDQKRLQIDRLWRLDRLQVCGAAAAAAAAVAAPRSKLANVSVSFRSPPLRFCHCYLARKKMTTNRLETRSCYSLFADAGYTIVIKSIMFRTPIYLRRVTVTVPVTVGRNVQTTLLPSNKCAAVTAAVEYG